MRWFQLAVCAALALSGPACGEAEVVVKTCTLGDQPGCAELCDGGHVESCRILALHHNVLRGQISNRWGLARPLEAQQRLVASGAELVLCGHDH